VQFCVDLAILGSAKHLSCDDDNLQWVDECVPEVFCLRPSINTGSATCLRTLALLNCVPIDLSPPKAYLEAFKLLFRNHDDSANIPWKDVLPKQKYGAFVRNVVTKLNAVVKQCDTKYYTHTFSRQTRVFQSLQPAKVNFENLKHAQQSERHETNQTTLASFIPNTKSFTKPVTYNRCSTRTGRLIIESGPQVLTLKKEYRNILSSRYDGGHVVSIDYSSLEARVMLYAAGKAPTGGDLYESISKEAFEGKLPRSAIKLGVLALIFGMGDPQLAATLKIDYQNAKKFSAKIRKYFCVSTLEKRLKKELEETKVLRNYYGRVLEVPEDKRNLVVNTYIQSTGVDVALLGFANLIDNMAEKQAEFVPLYVLHDALILDVSAKTYEQLPLLAKVAENIPEFVQHFPVHISEFSQ
jgi:DNA polymerase family A